MLIYCMIVYILPLMKTFFTLFTFWYLQAKDRGGLSPQVALDASKIDYHFFRWCFGENLFFRADGSVDSDPIHFWYPWLSENLKSSPMIESLKFKPASNFSLEALIRAHTPGIQEQIALLLKSTKMFKVISGSLCGQQQQPLVQQMLASSGARISNILR